MNLVSIADGVLAKETDLDTFQLVAVGSAQLFGRLVNGTAASATKVRDQFTRLFGHLPVLFLRGIFCPSRPHY